MLLGNLPELHTQEPLRIRAAKFREVAHDQAFAAAITRLMIEELIPSGSVQVNRSRDR